MLHGLITHPFSEAGIVDLEQNGLDGKATLDVFPTSWGDDKGYQIQGWGPPAWNGRAGSGSARQQKMNDLQNSFGGTGRRLCTMYNIGEYTDGSRGNSYYLPGARGDLDAEWKAFAEELISIGMEDTIIRPNAEHTHRWSRRYPTDANGNQLSPEEGGQQFADAYARCVSVMNGHRSVNGSRVSGGNFTFIFSPAGRMGARDNVVHESFPTKSSLWPADEDPPLVTVSHYDSNNRGGPGFWEWKDMSDAERKQAFDEHWHDFRKPFMDKYYNFAQSMGAGSAITEWGVKYPDDPQEDVASARGDNPYFLEYMIDYMKERDFVFEAMWTTMHHEGSHSVLWRMDDRGVFDHQNDGPDLAESWQAWKEIVIADAGNETPTVDIGDYNRPASGTTDWHVPLNENFANIERDVSTLADHLGISMSAAYSQPEAGTVDWHVPLNDNFAAIENDVQNLADALQNAPEVGGYNRPAKGTQNWDIPLNENFKAIQDDLNAIANRL